MGMDRETARKSIYQMFKDSWDATDGWEAVPGLTVEPPVFYDNIAPDEPPHSDAVKIEVKVIHTNKPMSSFGNGRPNYDAQGIVLVNVCVPKDSSGLILADRLVKIAERAFQGQRGTGVAEGLVFRGTTPNEEGARDRWFVVGVTTPFEYEDEV